MRIVDVVAGWLLIVFGAIHVSLTGKFDPNIGIGALWFASGGLFIITVGALNLLRVAYTDVAKGIYWVSVVGNVMLLLLIVLIATRVPMRGNPQVAVALFLAGLLMALSVLRRGGVHAHSIQAGK